MGMISSPIGKAGPDNLWSSYCVQWTRWSFKRSKDPALCSLWHRMSQDNEAFLSTKLEIFRSSFWLVCMLSLSTNHRRETNSCRDTLAGEGVMSHHTMSVLCFVAHWQSSTPHTYIATVYTVIPLTRLHVFINRKSVSHHSSIELSFVPRSRLGTVETRNLLKWIKCIP